MAVDAVFDSVIVGTTFQAELEKAGVIFCSISEAIQKHPDLVKKYLGLVVPITDNFFATLNSAVFSDGSFVYVPPGVRCPMELSTYFRINAENTGQFERTLIIADKGSYVSYLEGCTAPMRDTHQLHAAVVELVAMEDAEIKYSTVQNWYPGDENGRGGIYNFVTKRADCRGDRSKVMWTQVETGSAPSPGNTRPAFCGAMTVRVNFIRSPSPTTRSRPTRAPRWCIWARTRAAGSSRRASRRAARRTPIAGWSRCIKRQRIQPQLHAMRQFADRRSMRRAYGALYRGEEQFQPGRA